jgi:hypothetical protein
MKARLDNKIGSRSRQLYREEDAPRGEADMDRELDFMIFLGPKRGGGGGAHVGTGWGMSFGGGNTR